ncbi:MAG: hypothetical protein JWN78_3351 [Bacteroidota bacterium]|nr:hypothetical protein [Bacteroidota bacterium]
MVDGPWTIVKPNGMFGFFLHTAVGCFKYCTSQIPNQVWDDAVKARATKSPSQPTVILNLIASPVRFARVRI